MYEVSCVEHILAVFYFYFSFICVSVASSIRGGKNIPNFGLSKEE